MNASNVFLGLSLLGLAASSLVIFRKRLPGLLLIVQFLVGWLVGEMALLAFAVQGIATLLFIRAGVLETFAGQTAFAVTLASWALLGLAQMRSLGARKEFREALAPDGIIPEDNVSPLHGFLKPFAFKHPDVRVERNIAYGEVLPGDKGGRNLLDVYLPKSARQGDRCPVLLQVHGGAWIIGDKKEQAIPLMTHLAARGWICVTANYRLSPQAKMPAHIVDVKRAIAWIRENIESFGGDPDFLCITGGSAGGHLSSLAALTANDPAFQPGFEQIDTRLDGAVPFYGVFDFLDQADVRGPNKMADDLGPRIFGTTPEENPELWNSVSPINRVHADAPPFFVIQGSHDTLVFFEEAINFVAALREKSRQTVLHAELLGAQHAFEIFHSVRSAYSVRAATAFLERVRSDWEKARGEADVA